MARMIGMFCDVLHNTELCGRWNGHMDAGRWYSQFFGDVWQMWFQNVADVMTTVADVMATCEL